MIDKPQNDVLAVASLLRKNRAGVLLLILILGVTLRIRGIDASGFNEDEMNKLEAAHAYLHGDFSKNLEHPMLLKSMVAASLALNDFWGRELGRLRLPEETAVRLPNVVFGTLTAVVIFLIAEEFFGTAAGLAAALIWSTLTISVTINRIAKEDTLLVFFAWLGYYFYIRAKKDSLIDPQRSRKWYVASGASFGLMLASKYFPHYLGLLALFYYLPRNRKYPALGWRGYAAWLGTLLLVFALANPIIFVPSTWKYMLYYAGEGTMTHHGYLAMGRFYFDDPAHIHGGMPFYFYLLLLAVKTPIPVLIAFAVGLIEMIRRRHEDGPAFLLFMCLFWIVPFSLLSAKWLRWMLSWMPTVCIIAAVGVLRIFSWLRALMPRISQHRVWVRAPIAALCLVFFALPAVSTVQVGPFYSLYLNPLGFGRAGFYFPHDELDDIGLRPAARHLCEAAPARSTIVAEALPVLKFYFRQCGRDDLQYLDLSAVRPESLPSPAYVLIQEGRKYFDNVSTIQAIECEASCSWTITVGGVRAATVIPHL